MEARNNAPLSGAGSLREVAPKTFYSPPKANRVLRTGRRLWALENATTD